MRSLTRIVLVAGALGCLAPSGASGQQGPTTSAQTEKKRFEVTAVDGNTVVIRDAAGTREITAPADFRVMVNGQSMPVSELKPGMTGMATITTTTTTTPVT